MSSFKHAAQSKVSILRLTAMLTLPWQRDKAPPYRPPLPLARHKCGIAVTSCWVTGRENFLQRSLVKHNMLKVQANTLTSQQCTFPINYFRKSKHTKIT
jgi:hypothetical protein